MTQIFGYFGLILLLICWLPETYKTWQDKSCGIGKPFLWLYLSASIFLAVQAYLDGSVPFILLNVFSGINSAINLRYAK